MSYDILIADNSKTIRAILKRALDIAGVPIASAREASDGRRALAVLRERAVDLVFSDLNMPEMDGMQLLQSMQADPQLRNIPVVIVTADRNADKAREATSLGAKAVLRKPFRPEQLRELVANLLE